MNILIVEDNEPQRNMLEMFFREKGQEVIVASNVKDAEEMIAEHEPDVLLLDWMLPDGSGVDLTQQLRMNGYSGWIVLLTARSDTDSKVSGLNAGADDYVSKPFRVRELEARLGTATRRLAELKANQWYSATVRVGDLVIEREQHKAYNAVGDLIPLTPLEYSVLHRLVLRHPEVATRVELRAEAWGVAYAGSYNPLYATINRLKGKLLDAGVQEVEVKAAYRKGYRLEVG